MDPNQLFAQALPLEPPWTVTSSAFEGNPKKLSLTVDLLVGTKRLPCPCCGEQSRIHDRRERRWRHLNFWQYETELVAEVPRTDCTKCGVHQVEVSWARPGSGFTLLFEAWALLLVREMAVSEAAQTLGIQDTRLWRLLDHYVEKAHAGLDWSRLKRVGLDETSRRKEHRYVTCFIDLDSGNLLYLTEGQDAATVAAFAAELVAHQSTPEAIAEVAMDMSPAFQRGVEQHLPNALKVFDRYHVMALAGKAVDEVRKEVAREEGGLEKGAMWSLRGNKERLKVEQLEQRERLCQQYSKLGRALSWREFLADAWRYATREAAEEHLESVYSGGGGAALSRSRSSAPLSSDTGRGSSTTTGTGPPAPSWRASTAVSSWRENGPGATATGRTSGPSPTGSPEVSIPLPGCHAHYHDASEHHTNQRSADREKRLNHHRHGNATH